MDSYLKIGILLAALLAFCGSAHGQHRSCQEISDCIGPDFSKAVMNKDMDKGKVCKVFQEALDCMNPKVDECATHVSPQMATMFTQQRDTMVTNMEKSCKSSPKVTTTGCNYMECVRLENCKLFECVTKVREECPDNNLWKTLYKGEFKTSYDKVAATCGCNNLKSSLAIILISTISMLLFVFKN